VSRHTRPCNPVTGLLAAFALCVFQGLTSLAWAFDRSESHLKAGFLYNFVKYTEWPAAVSKRIVCVAPGALAYEALSGLDGLPLPNNSSLVTRLVGAPSDAKDCDILFLGRAQRGVFDAWLNAVSNRAVLTVSDMGSAERFGAMIQLFTEGRRIRYALDLAPTRRAGLTLNPRLRNLADTLYNE
jgi:hypothetical protein